MAVSDSELARALFPKPRAVVAEGTGDADLVTVSMGRAASDSENGNVSVILDMDAIGADAAIDVPTGARIKEGDTVMVTISGNSAVDAVAAGWGDQLGEQVDSVTNYFWHDSSGAHVATVEGDATTGKNILIDSDSLDIRNGESLLANFSAQEANIGIVEDTGGGIDWDTTVATVNLSIVNDIPALSVIGGYSEDYENAHAVLKTGTTLDMLLTDGNGNEVSGLNLGSDSGLGAIDHCIELWEKNGATKKIFFGIGSDSWNISDYVRFQGQTLSYYKTIDAFIADLQSGGGGNPAVDYVIQQGTTSNGSYRKWSSGKMEQWVSQTVTTVINTVWGGTYRNTPIVTGVYWPTTFATISHCFTTLTGNGGDMAWVASASAATTTKTDDFYLLRGAALTSSKSFQINHYGVGTWGSGETINIADETEY